jgi:hypothetical protein
VKFSPLLVLASIASVTNNLSLDSDEILLQILLIIFQHYNSFRMCAVEMSLAGKGKLLVTPANTRELCMNLPSLRAKTNNGGKHAMNIILPDDSNQQTCTLPQTNLINTS